MTPAALIAVLAAAVLAAALSWWSYARLEEPVPGRRGPALLRGLALFLIFAGWWLPALWAGRDGDSRTVAVLVDASLSMSLPVRAGGPVRADSAAAVVAATDADLRFLFGDSARAGTAPGAGADGVGVGIPFDGASRLVPALEVARAAGADSVVLVTDGELDDREAARAAARRLGLAVREERVSGGQPRLTIRGIDGPASVETGDTVRLVIEVGALGEEPVADSASLSVTSPDGARSILTFAAPSPGRTMRVAAAVVAAPGDDGPWRAYDVRLEPDADPIGPGARHRTWVETVPTAAGTVIVGADADWEPHYLLPVLARSTAGGARAWLRVGNDRWIRSGTERMLTGDDARVRRDALNAELLVIQGTPGGLPGWLAQVAARHPRVLFLARDAGEIPGSSMRVGAALPGEWYAGGTPPSSPIAGYLEATDYPGLPPVSRLFTLDGQDWAPLELRRNRSGAGRPPIGAERSGGRRRVVVAAEGMWRWASRSGAARQAYRSVFAGLAGWLLEAPDRNPVVLESVRLVAGDTVRWRVASDVSNLRITVRDSSGEAVWVDTIAAPDTLVAGLAVAGGSHRFEAEGAAGGEPFRGGRPFEVEGAERELVGRVVGEPLQGAQTGGAALAAGSDRPIWPFVLAALMLCGEWLWRRRIGLR